MIDEFASPHDLISDFLQRFSLDRDADERALRRAYARELKLIDQKHDAAAFQALREAYEAAQSWLVRRTAGMEDEESEFSSAQWQIFSSVLDAAAPPDADKHELLFEPENHDPSLLKNTTQFPEQGDLPADVGEVLSEFLRDLYRLADASSHLDIKAVQNLLRHCMADVRLESIDARDAFEQAIADVLVQGWKPGHEFLLTAALLQFAWDSDPRRVLRLNHAGHVIDWALIERRHFLAQGRVRRDEQFYLIMTLRKGTRLDEEVLVGKLPLVIGLVQRYPNLMAIIVDKNRIQQWQQWEAEVPESRRRKFVRSEMNAPNVPRDTSFPDWRLLPVACVVLFEVIKYVLRD